MGAGGGGKQQESTSTTEPWQGQQPYLQKMFAEAQRLYSQGGPKPYGGTTVAPFAPNEVAGRQAAVAAAQGPQQQLANSAAGAVNYLSDPRILSPETNPYLAQYAQAAAQPLYQNLTESVLPALRSESLGAGTYGSNRQGIAEGLAAGRTAEAVQRQTGDIYNQAYQQGLEALTRGAALAPTAQAAQLAPAETLSSVGAQGRAYNQALIDQAIQKYNYQQSLPYTNLAQFQNFIQGGYGGQTTAQQAMPGGNPLLQGLGGGLAGAGTGALLGSAVMPGIGTGVGAAAGGLLGILPAFLG